MLLPRELIAYLSRQIVTKLSPTTFEVTNPQGAVELVHSVIYEELSAEDRLNEEVREILSQYSDYMRREGVSYQEMFRKIKNTLISQRKVVRASGRDTGDHLVCQSRFVDRFGAARLRAERKAGSSGGSPERFIDVPMESRQRLGGRAAHRALLLRHHGQGRGGESHRVADLQASDRAIGGD